MKHPVVEYSLIQLSFQNNENLKMKARIAEAKKRIQELKQSKDPITQMKENLKRQQTLDPDEVPTVPPGLTAAKRPQQDFLRTKTFPRPKQPAEEQKPVQQTMQQSLLKHCQKPVPSGAVSKIRKPTNPSDLRLFVKNLRPETNEESLRKYFSHWGIVTDIFIRKAKHRYVGSRNAMAYITFSSYFNESPLSSGYIHIIDGMSVPVCTVHAHPNCDYDGVKKSCTIMVTGMVHNLSDSELTVHFSRYGKVINLIRKPDVDNPGNYLRFAFICFSDTSSVDKALLESNVIRGHVVDVRRVADRK